MLNIWSYTLISVFIISSISLIGVATLAIGEKKLKSILIYLVSFSAGVLFGDSFIHLLPEAVEKSGFNLKLSLSLLLGIVLFFIVEKFVYWRHCREMPCKDHVHPFAFMNLLGDGLHNFIDGVIIAVSYLISIPVGIATTIAVVLHEIPQEIADFGVLLHGGFSKSKAILLNFVSAVASVLGAALGLLISSRISGFADFLVPFAAGGFIYIAGSDLIPELHKETKPIKSLLQLLIFIFGICVMVALTLIE